MKHLLCVLLIMTAAGALLAQTPPPVENPKPQAPPSKPQPPTSKPSQPPPTTKPPQPRTSGAGLALSVQVTDRSGNPVGDVAVRVTGPVDRTGATAQDGTIAFRALRGGTYRLRFEREGFITLEREVTLTNRSVEVSTALSAAPAPPKPEPAVPLPEPEPPPARTPRPMVPHALSIADYLDKNLIGSEPVKTSMLACAEGGTAVLLQVREPLKERQHADADEMLYVVAGDGILSIRNQDTKVPHGHFAFVPRGTPHSLRRDGRNPMIAISVLAGPTCTDPTPPVK